MKVQCFTGFVFRGWFFFLLIPVLLVGCARVGNLTNGETQTNLPVTQAVSQPTEPTLPAESTVFITPTRSVEPTLSVEGVQDSVQPMQIAEQGYTQQEKQLFYGFVLHNPNVHWLAYNVSCRIVAYDAMNTEVATKDVVMPLFLPMQFLGISGKIAVALDSEITRMEIVPQPERFQAVDTTHLLPAFAIEHVGFGDESFSTAMGVVRNTSANDVRNVPIAVVAYSAAGQIVGGGHAAIDILAAGEQQTIAVPLHTASMPDGGVTMYALPYDQQIQKIDDMVAEFFAPQKSVAMANVADDVTPTVVSDTFTIETTNESAYIAPVNTTAKMSNTATNTHISQFTETLVATDTPTMLPTDTPTMLPTDTPTMLPTDTPTMLPTDTPTMLPTDTPTMLPTDTPTMLPTDTPTMLPTDTPTMLPTDTPTVLSTETQTTVVTDTQTTVVTNTPIVLTTDTPSVADYPTLEIGIKGEELAFDKDMLSITIAEGQPMVVHLTNTSSTQEHNWVLFNHNDMDMAETFNDVAMSEVDTSYFPEDNAELVGTVLAHIVNQQPGDDEHVVFDAPPPGEYLYICTVPGHFAAGDYGVLTVNAP